MPAGLADTSFAIPVKVTAVTAAITNIFNDFILIPLI